MADSTDRFSTKHPTFHPTSNQSAIEAITPQQKDNTPSLSVVERLKQDGNIYLASLLQEAQQQAKQHATLASERAQLRTREPREVKVKEASSQLPSHERLSSFEEYTSHFQASDRVDDKEFIRRTRSGDYHSPEMKALFYANGGDQFLVGGISYAVAFDNLRREKMRKLQGAKQVSSTPYQRHTSVIPGAKVITPGMPSQQDRDRQRQAQQEASVREELTTANEKWAGIKK